MGGENEAEAVVAAFTRSAFDGFGQVDSLADLGQGIVVEGQIDAHFGFLMLTYMSIYVSIIQE